MTGGPPRGCIRSFGRRAPNFAATRVLVTVRDSVGFAHVPDAADFRLVSEWVEAAPR